MTRQWEGDIEPIVGGLRKRARRIHEANPVQSPSRRRQQPDPGASDIDKAASLAAEMRGLISDAHGAAKDLRSALAEYRQLLGDVEKTVDAAMERSANQALRQWVNHIQKEQNKHAASLNESVEAARAHVIKCLTLAELKFDRKDSSTLHFRFDGPRAAFDADTPPPHPEAGLPEGKI